MQLRREVVLDAVRPRLVGEQDGRVHDAHQPQQAVDVQPVDAAALHRAPERPRADLARLVALHEVDELGGRRRHRRHLRAGDQRVVVDVEDEETLRLVDEAVHRGRLRDAPHRLVQPRQTHVAPDQVVLQRHEYCLGGTSSHVVTASINI